MTAENSSLFYHKILFVVDNQTVDYKISLTGDQLVWVMIGDRPSVIPNNVEPVSYLQITACPSWTYLIRNILRL